MACSCPAHPCTWPTMALCSQELPQLRVRLPSLHMARTLTYKHAPADGKSAAQSVYDENYKEVGGKFYDKS